jgi:hypothetical protein
LAETEMVAVTLTIEQSGYWPAHEDVPIEELARRRGLGGLRHRVPDAMARHLTGRSLAVATVWGGLRAHGQLRGRPRPANDT